ncbi:MAG: hypothetical protein J1F36_03620 [Clostridiales bacterium]|nr:hypothetical protein [Clostridiales bacterium]
MDIKMEKLRDILLTHTGKQNRITSAQIAAQLGIIEDATYATTRALILATAEKYEIALAADARGYYVISNDEEYYNYMNNLDARISGICERKRIITSNYKGENR